MGGPISTRLAPAAQPASSSDDIQFAPLMSEPPPRPPVGKPPRPPTGKPPPPVRPPKPPMPKLRGQEWPTRGMPSLPTLLVQSWQVLLQSIEYTWPLLLVPV